jgi:hypothetical protein
MGAVQGEEAPTPTTRRRPTFTHASNRVEADRNRPPPPMAGPGRNRERALRPEAITCPIVDEPPPLSHNPRRPFGRGSEPEEQNLPPEAAGDRIGRPPRPEAAAVNTEEQNLPPEAAGPPRRMAFRPPRRSAGQRVLSGPGLGPEGPLAEADQPSLLPEAAGDLTRTSCRPPPESASQPVRDGEPGCMSDAGEPRSGLSPPPAPPPMAARSADDRGLAAESLAPATDDQACGGSPPVGQSPRWVFVLPVVRPNAKEHLTTGWQ